jgi:hypothetical protein
MRDDLLGRPVCSLQRKWFLGEEAWIELMSAGDHRSKNMKDERAGRGEALAEEVLNQRPSPHSSRMHRVLD